MVAQKVLYGKTQMYFLTQYLYIYTHILHTHTHTHKIMLYKHCNPIKVISYFNY